MSSSRAVVHAAFLRGKVYHIFLVGWKTLDLVGGSMVTQIYLGTV